QPEGTGLDQGAVARVEETLARSIDGTGAAPGAGAVRNYVGIGITTKGRRGPPSPRTAVPLVPAPPPPSMPAVTYTETAVTLKWEAPPSKTQYNVYEVPAATIRLKPDPTPTSIRLKPDPTREGQQLKPGSTQEAQQLTKNPIAE